MWNLILYIPRWSSWMFFYPFKTCYVKKKQKKTCYVYADGWRDISFWKSQATFDFNITAKFIHFIRKERGVRRHVFLSTCCQKWVSCNLETKSWLWTDDKTPMTVICPSDENRQIGSSWGPRGLPENGSRSGIRAEISPSCFQIVFAACSQDVESGKSRCEHWTQPVEFTVF